MSPNETHCSFSAVVASLALYFRMERRHSTWWAAAHPQVLLRRDLTQQPGHSLWLSRHEGEPALGLPEGKSSRRAFPNCRAKGLLTQCFLLKHTDGNCYPDMCTRVWLTCLETTSKDEGKDRVCWKRHAFGFVCDTYTHHNQLWLKKWLWTWTLAPQGRDESYPRQFSNGGTTNPINTWTQVYFLRALILTRVHTHTQINASIHLLYISGSFAWELSGLWQVHLHK